MAPRFVNPHFVAESTQIVSRADLEDTYNVSREDVVEDHDAVATLENLLKRSLGEFQAENAEPLIEHKKKKRKKEDKTHTAESPPETRPRDAEDVLVSFRLLSKAPKLVSLKPKPAPEIIVVERAWEDDDHAAELRTERASAAAVDFSWIIEQAKTPDYPRPNDDKKIIHVSAEAFDTTAPVVVFDIPRPAVHTGIVSESTLNLPHKTIPNPHDFPADKIFCQVVPAAPSPTGPGASNLHNKARRRRKKISPEPRPPPSFWRPAQAWGGKSAGYAMGFVGSRPIPTGSVRQWRYRRDTMRKGAFTI